MSNNSKSTDLSKWYLEIVKKLINYQEDESTRYI